MSTAQLFLLMPVGLPSNSVHLFKSEGLTNKVYELP